MESRNKRKKKKQSGGVESMYDLQRVCSTTLHTTNSLTHSATHSLTHLENGTSFYRSPADTHTAIGAPQRKKSGKRSDRKFFGDS